MEEVHTQLLCSHPGQVFKNLYQFPKIVTSATSFVGMLSLELKHLGNIHENTKQKQNGYVAVPVRAPSHLHHLYVSRSA